MHRKRIPFHSAATLAGLGLLLAAQLLAGIPNAIDDTVPNLGQQQAVDVLANDSEPDGLALDLSIVDAGTCAASVQVVDGLVLHTPAFGDRATCTMTYRVQADGSGHDTATLTFEIVPSIFADGFESNSLAAWEVIQ